MKTILFSILVFFLTLFLYTKLTGPIPFAVNQTTTNKTDLFTVTGQGKAVAVPDLAKVTVGVQAQGTSVKAVQDELNKNITTVSSSIQKLGIDKKDITTINYSLTPTYDYTKGRGQIVGYSAQSNLEVTVRQIDQANSVIDGATGSGANIIGGVVFDVDNKSTYENEARKQAINEAKSKAQDAARAAGFSLGKILNYQETMNGNEPRPYLMAAKATNDAAVETQVQPGSQEIVLTVTLSYELR